MLGVIAWKEWRQQVALVIAILALAGIVLAATAISMPREWASRSSGVSGGAMWVILLIGLAFTQGLVTGSMLFAGEAEERTQEFLDQHIGLRSPLWQAKILSGLSLVGVSSLLLGGLIVALDLGGTFLLAACVWIALDAMVWSALCSVNRKTTFGAIGVALAVLLWVDGFTLAFLFHDESRLAYFIVKIPLLLFALGLSWRLYCSADLQRVSAPARPWTPATWFATPAWLRISLWHLWTRRKGTLALLVVGPVVAGWATLRFDPLFAWPFGTFLLGGIAGWAVFADEQAQEAERFLGDQRFPRWKLWLGKTLPLLLLTMLGCAAAFFLFATILQERRDGSRSDYTFLVNFDAPVRGFLPYSLAFALQGFGFALFAGQQCRKLPVAIFLTLALGGGYAAFWYPSLIAGMPPWPAGLVAVLLSLATLWLWPRWTSGRLHDRGGVVRLCGILAAALFFLAGNLWYRAVQIPDPGAPFDTQSYWKSLTDTPDDAGEKLRALGKEIEERIAAADKRFDDPNFVDPEPIEHWQHVNWGSIREQILNKGLPEQPGKYREYLAFVSDGDWMTRFKKCAREKPDRLQPIADSQRPSMSGGFGVVSGADLFLIHALIQFESGKKSEAVDDLSVALAAIRHGLHRGWGWTVRFFLRSNVEALSVAERLIEKSDGDVAFLSEMRSMLNAHAGLVGTPARRSENRSEALPSFAGIVKSSYFQSNESSGLPPAEIEAVLIGAPWERVRVERMRRHIFATLIQQADIDRFPPPEQREAEFSWYFGSEPLFGWSERGRRTNDGRIWGDPAFRDLYSLIYDRQRYVNGLVYLRGLTLMVAAAEFEAKRGRPIDSLKELIPTYFEKLPESPYVGHSFQFRVSHGEYVAHARPDLHSVEPPLNVAGQRLIFDSSSPSIAFPVPTPIKK